MGAENETKTFFCIKGRPKGSQIEVGHREIIRPPIASIHLYTSVCLDCRVELCCFFIELQSWFVTRLTRLRYQKSTWVCPDCKLFNGACLFFGVNILSHELWSAPLLRKGKCVDKPQFSYLLLQGYCGSDVYKLWFHPLDSHIVAGPASALATLRLSLAKEQHNFIASAPDFVCVFSSVSLKSYLSIYVNISS